MADFTTANLCGGSDKLNKILTDVKTLKDGIVAKHGADASAALSTVETLVTDVTTSLKEQIDSSKESQKLFEILLIDYIKTNQLDDYKELLESLSKKRYKNSIDKKKIMKKLINEELSEEEKIIERKKYAILIQENKEFIDMINELRKPNTNYIMIEEPKITIHNKDNN